MLDFTLRDPALRSLAESIGADLPRALERYERRGYVQGWRWGWVCGAVMGACSAGLGVLLVQTLIHAAAAA